MPRPTLRRTVSTPHVRPRASSNPYPPRSPVTTRSMTAAMIAEQAETSTSGLSSAVPSSGGPRARRVNSVSRLSSPTTSMAAASASDSRRVLADITYCYDGQLTSMAEAPLPTALPSISDAAPVLGAAGPSRIGGIPELDDHMEQLTLSARASMSSVPLPPPGIMEEEEEGTPQEERGEILVPVRVATPEPSEAGPTDPFALLGNPDSQPSSTNSSPGNTARRVRPAIGRSVSEGMRGAFDQPWRIPMDLEVIISTRTRRESSFSSLSGCSDFEDCVPSPSYT